MLTVAGHVGLEALVRQEAAAAPCVRTEALAKSIDGRLILDGINLEIEAGSMVAILGANGAGKSTLLRLLSTLLPPSSGRVELFGTAVGRDDARLRARIGLVSHQLMLYRDLSALENIEFFGRLSGVADPRRRALELLEWFGLGDRMHASIRTLSRGTAQRVAIARALVHGPELLLADEPFTGLDLAGSEWMEERFKELRARGMTIVLANHDIEQCRRIATRAVVLCAGGIVLDMPAPGLNGAIIRTHIGGAA